MKYLLVIGDGMADNPVARLGGSLDVANAEGGGCRITIRLPLSNPTVGSS